MQEYKFEAPQIGQFVEMVVLKRNRHFKEIPVLLTVKVEYIKLLPKGFVNIGWAYYGEKKWPKERGECSANLPLKEISTETLNQKILNGKRKTYHRLSKKLGEIAEHIIALENNND